MSNGPSAPPTVAFNPDARPPPSTLINAAKARELPSGKESYERPLNPPVPDEQRSATLSEGYRYPTPPQHLNVPTETEKPKSRRPTRFSPLAPKKNLEQDHPVLLQDRVATQDHPTTTSPKEPSQGHATPPPMSREPSMLSLTDHLSAQRSDRGQSSDGRSDGSRAGPRVRYMDQREDLPVPSRLPDDRPPSATSGTQPRRKDPLSTSSAPHTEATAFHRPRPSKWSEQMSIAGAAPGEHSSEDAATADLDDLPSLSRRLSSEKPPRHRKYSGGFIAPDGKFPTDSVSHSLPTPAGSGRESQDDTLSFKDRLEKPNTQRRGQQIPLLDRLSSAGDSSRVNVQDVQQQSLRERLIPSKRDREDMMMDEGDPRDLSYDGEDGNESKRARRRNPKGKRGGRR
ncbi:hypothetical protein BDZ97DRAFT_94483 [Flammula alnicola]|nr:hypothetical protein BDZ97DRAFT_94483 [Flammula alnicola]